MVTTVSFRDGGLFIFVKEMINIAIKLATSITYTVDGSQTNFSVPFDYLRPSFVHVSVNDAEVSEGFTISNRMVMFDSAPAKDAAVRIYRSTPTTRLVSWADASILKAIDMTIAEVQQLHILEEANDWTKTNSIVLNDEGNAWQGRNYRVSNVADPVDAQDVVTKHYLDNEEGSFTATMNALKTKTEEAASTAETNAKQARLNAEKASSASTAADRDALSALQSSQRAQTSETNAKTSEEAAQSAANSASNFATDARSSANEAKSYRDAASTYATNAKNYSENVNVFVPSVSAEGVLSWSNKAGLANPPSVNIKGKDGNITVDDTLSDTSTNAIQNKVVKAALDNRAVLDENNIFTSPNNFADIYMEDGMSSLKWFNGSPNFVVASINSKRYTGEANTAKKATKDGDGNIITSTYATKTELNSCVKSVNNVTPDTNGNVNITVSGGGSGVTVDEELSSTSTNPVQNKTIYNALLNKAGTDIFSGFDLNSPSATIRWRSGSQNYGILTASNYSGTALRATQDGAGNIITETYAKKTDISNATVDATLSATSTNAIANKAVYSALSDKLGKTDTAVAATVATRALQDGNGNVISSTYIKSVNNVTPDENGNVAITVSGGGSNITVDAELSATSTNPVQNKVIKGALDDKANLNKNNTFSKENYFQKGMSLIAYRDLDSAIKWYQSTANPPIASIDDTNYTGNAASATKATQDSAGNVITETYAKKADVSGVVKSVNGTKPDASGNVSIAVSGGGGVSTSESNTWTAEQIFQYLAIMNEKYSTYVVNGTSDTPVLATMAYTVTGAFTLNLSVLVNKLNTGQTSVFTAYFSANADYPLTITNAGTLKYIGSASDVAITSAGLLLNILVTKDASGNLTSIIQASKLS